MGYTQFQTVSGKYDGDCSDLEKATVREIATKSYTIQLDKL
jgi:hypothetical protein